MAIFPEPSSISYGSPVSKSIEFKTLVQEFESGVITRKQKRTYPLRKYLIKYPYTRDEYVCTLFQFFIARKGRSEDFVFFDANSSHVYVKEYTGTGDGSTVVFDLPSKSATSRTLYVNNVAQTEGGVDWTFSEGEGTDGEDRCTFVSAPSNGARITFSFTGRLKVRCIFESDLMDFDEFYNVLASTGLKLRGLLNT